MPCMQYYEIQSDIAAVLERGPEKMEEIGFVTTWKSRKEAGCQVQLHQHNFHELVYYTQGSGTTAIRGETWEFAARTYAMIPPGIRHDERHRIEGEVYCLGFRTERNVNLAFRCDTDGEMFRLVKAILTESVQQRFGYREMIGAKLMELTVLLGRAGNHGDVQAPKNFEYVVNYLSENYYEKIVFTELASHLKLSYDYFQHRFRRLMGVSPQRFLLQKRLEAAEEMLTGSQASCTEIAYRCGFSNSSQFSMLFKREKGVTPYQFRQSRKPTEAP